MISTALALASPSSTSPNVMLSTTTTTTTTSNNVAPQQALILLWFTLPPILRFLTSASIGNIVFFVLDQLFYTQVLQRLSKKALPKFVRQNMETASFFVAYSLQIPVQHLLNAALVFGWDTISNNRESYFGTLATTYSAYFVTLCASTFCNAFLRKEGVEKNIAFWVTIFGFGVVNFIVLDALIAKKTGELPIEPLVVDKHGRGRRAGVSTLHPAVHQRGGAHYDVMNKRNLIKSMHFISGSR